MKKNTTTLRAFKPVSLPLSLLLVAVLLSASTCERSLDIDLPIPDPKLVVVSNFTNNQELRVRVSKSRSLLDESPEDYIGDAVVELYQGDQLLEMLTLIVPQEPRVSPYYATKLTSLQTGVVYLIKVSAPGFDTVMAQSAIPQSISIQEFSLSDLQVTQGANPNSTRYSYRIALGFQDPPKIENYYHLNFYQQIQDYLDIGGDTLILRDYLQPVVFNSFNDNNYLLAYFGGGVLIEDGPYDGRTLNYSFPMAIDIYPANQKLGKIFVELRSVSKEYYYFHNSLSRQQNNNGNGNNEPIFIYNNIENGQGIFAGYSQSLDSLLIIH